MGLSTTSNSLGLKVDVVHGSIDSIFSSDGKFSLLSPETLQVKYEHLFMGFLGNFVNQSSSTLINISEEICKLFFTILKHFTSRGPASP